MGKPNENKTVLLYKLYLLVFLLFTKIIYLEKKIIYLSIRSSLGLGTGHYLSPGRGGGGFGAKQGEIHPIPPLNVTSLK